MLQDMYVTRFLFIREFTRQLIINSKAKEEPLKVAIKENPILELPKALEVPVPSYVKNSEEKDEFLSTQKTYKSTPLDVGNTQSFLGLQKQQPFSLQKPKPVLRTPPVFKLPVKQLEKPVPIKNIIVQPKIADSGMTPSILHSELAIRKNFPAQKLNVAEIMPAIEKVPQGFNLGKIELLTRDPKVNAIECLGPDKFVLVRVFGKINSTKIKLNQQEIQDIIQRFSKATKIPIISGLFKAAVGNLVITAVISDVVGSRFIITRVTPFQF